MKYEVELEKWCVVRYTVEAESAEEAKSSAIDEAQCDDRMAIYTVMNVFEE